MSNKTVILPEKYISTVWRTDSNTGQTTACSFTSSDCFNKANETVVTYNFPQFFNDPDGERKDIGFGVIQQRSVRKYMDDIEKFHPIKFKQVANDDKAEISFVHYRTVDVLMRGAVGRASFPSTNGGYSSIAYGLLGASERDSLNLAFNPLSDTGYVAAYKSTLGAGTVKHEIGHNLGLKHTHPEFRGRASIMSYKHDISLDSFGPVDHALLDYGYGSKVNPDKMGFRKEDGKYFIPEQVNRSNFTFKDGLAGAKGAIGEYSPMVATVLAGATLLMPFGLHFMKKLSNQYKKAKTSCLGGLVDNDIGVQVTPDNVDLEQANHTENVNIDRQGNGSDKKRKSAKRAVEGAFYDVLEGAIYGLSPAIVATHAPSRSFALEESRYLNGKKNFSSAVGEAVTKAAVQTVFYGVTRSLGLVGRNAQAIGWVANAAIDIEKLFEGKWQESIRGGQAICKL